MKIFISYRRDDSQDVTGRIADRLRALGEVENVFVDVENIRAGTIFENTTDSEIADSDICLVIIGQNWVGPNTEKGSKIFDESDFVRREIVAALNADCQVIPVLVNGATMPADSDLPDDLHRLNKISAAMIDHVSFDPDMNLLIKTIRKDWNEESCNTFSSVGRLAVKVCVGGALAFVLFVVAMAVYSEITGVYLVDVLGTESRMWLVSIAVILLGTVYPIVAYLRKRP